MGAAYFFMNIDFMPASAPSITEICASLAESVGAIFPAAWKPTVVFKVEDNPLRKILAGEYEFRITVKAPTDGLAKN